MANRRVLLPLAGEDVAPRFDAALAVLLAELDDAGDMVSSETIVLPRASADELCEFVLVHGVTAVIANGIPEDHFHYLRWKRVEVVDDVMGPAEEALRLFAAGTLQTGAIVYPARPAIAGTEGGAAA